MPDETRMLVRLRQNIDAVDARLLRLLHRRMQIARRIGRLKRQLGQPWVDLRRERAIMVRLRRRARQPLTTAALRAIYAQIFRHTRAVQRPAPSRGRR